MKYTIVLLLDDHDMIASRFSADENFEVIATTDNGNEGIRIIRERKPDAVICDLILKEADGLTVLENAKGSQTKFIVYSAFDSDDIIRRACRKGAAMYLIKPLAPEILIERVKDVLSGSNENTVTNVADKDDSAAELRISNVFLSAGIPPHIKGFSFLRTGVKLAMNKPEILCNITKELYPKIAESYDTSPSKVERAIRHAIEVAWNRGRIENLNSIFGVNFYTSGDKPTNGEFIALVADRLIQEKRMGKW